MYNVFWKAVNEKAFFPVVVLYTGESCAFCQVASHVFQTLKGLISSELVEFVSVDASANDLPWAFTALAVPSVLYFHPSSSTSSKPKAATHTTASSAATFSNWILLRTLELWYFVTKIVLTDWEKIGLVIEKIFWRSSLKAESLQKFWDH